MIVMRSLKLGWSVKMLDGDVLAAVQRKYKLSKEIRSFHLVETTEKTKVSAYVMRRRAKPEKHMVLCPHQSLFLSCGYSEINKPNFCEIERKSQNGKDILRPFVCK